MDVIELHDRRGGSAARIAPGFGFNCFQFQASVDDRTVDVTDVDGEPQQIGERPSWHGIPLLFPFPNRIRGGRFTWNGQEYDLNDTGVRFDPTGNAIHGFCLDRPWRVVERDVQSVQGAFQLSVDAPERLPLWPADFLIEVRYQVRGALLRADVRVHNPDSQPLPWGFGTHPYFRLPLSAESSPSQCLIQAPAHEQWELVDCLPTGTLQPVVPEKDLRDGAYFDVLKLDDVQTGLKPTGNAVETSIVDEKAGLQVVQQFDPVFRELVVFTPPGRNAVCLEPYTCVTDAINLTARGVDAGWRTLEPGGEFRTWFEIEAGFIVV